jgi:cytochrome c biogenesis protein CcdA
MTLDAVLIGFALTAGAVAFLNPCGFVMLPTYVSYFIQSDSSSFPTSTHSLNFNTTTKMNRNAVHISVKKLAKGALIGLLVTAAFIAVFGLVGLAISAIGIGVAKLLPWIAVSSGVLIMGIGVAKIFGKMLHMNIPSPTGFIHISGGNTINKKKSSFVSFFLFGIGYAIASLSCTLPIFLLVVFQGLSAGGIGEGSIVFLAYALGMGGVMTVISFAINLSNQTFIRWLRKLTPKMNFITSILLIMAGSYLIYYNLIIGKLLSFL